MYQTVLRYALIIKGRIINRQLIIICWSNQMEKKDAYEHWKEYRFIYRTLENNKLMIIAAASPGLI